MSKSTVSSDRQSKLAKRITMLVVALFTLYLSYLCAQLIWVGLESPQRELPQSFANSANSGASSKRVQRSVERYHLFGEAGKAVVVSEKPKDAPKTRLRLTLKGVFTAQDVSESGAIIAETGKSSEYYRIGEELPGNVRLAEVYPDHVLLDRAGNYESLYFDEKTASSQIAKVPQKTKRRSNDVSTPEDFIEEATARLSENPTRALASVGLGVAEGGGYVFQGNNPMLSGMNLQKGDVIRSVNGHSLGDLEQDKKMMGSLYHQGSVEVEVVRDGASFFVNYPLR